jgi:two-component system sensor histidine kinase KdpD
MLENARRAHAEGREVVVGYVEPHGRPETEALLAGLAAIPVRACEYRGVTLRDFDVDSALARRPDLILVDELAHTNAAGCRHEKRWQDVEELLKAGINVWTTLNVQHIESLNDVIGQITGVTVREAVPDRVFDLADDLELVDITPKELLLRLKAGKVYVPEQAQRAIQSFFQKSNRTALRELSLRQAARRIRMDVESARRERAALHPWATAERLLVCVGPSPTTDRVIRTARGMAAALDAHWLAVSVDLTGKPSSNPDKQQVSQHFRLAERLGAETVTLAGQNVTDTILDYARSRNVTKILIGKTSQPRWRRLIVGTVVDDVLDKSGEIDVYVIYGEEQRVEHAPARTAPSSVAKLPYLVASARSA